MSYFNRESDLRNCLEFALIEEWHDEKDTIMFDYLFKISDLTLFILLAGFSIGFTIIILTAIKYLIPIEGRYKENAVIGSISAVIGIIYAVLVGLTALYLTNTNSATSVAVQREADGAASIYRSSRWLAEPVRTEVQKLLRRYILEVIHVEWPLMENGKTITKDGDQLIDQMENALSTYKITTAMESLILRDMLESIKQLYEGRQDRILMSYSELNPEIWEVILIGTLLTVFVNYLFGMHFILHIVLSSASALMAMSMLFLLLALDRPFQGDFVVQPDSLNALLNDMNHAIDKRR